MPLLLSSLVRLPAVAGALFTLLFAATVSADEKLVVFIAGKPSHGFGAHEHYAGCRLLAEALNANMPGVTAVVHKNGWPSDPKALEGADCIVMYADGGDGHYVNQRLNQVEPLMKKGVGLVCIHYAVEVPKGEVGDRFLDWIGGYFETFWSVNPHWDADFQSLPEHPITRGVRPFKINDEWYYHMRFRDGMQGVTPILTAVPPDETRTRAYGTARGGNPEVVKRRGMPEHVAWATERPDGGRGFGFTGGHVHWNWGNDDFRKLVLNAIVWAAHGDVPADGVASQPLTQEDLEQNLDAPNPRKADQVRQALQEHSKPKFQSEKLTKSNPTVDVDVDVTGAENLYLVVTDAGDGYACDWADWIAPRLVGPEGEKKLTELKWKAASTDWGSVHVDRNAAGGPLKVAGELVGTGIGTHANSIIHFELPKGHTYTRFQATAGLDNGGTDQGNVTSVQFLVFTEAPPSTALSGQESREAKDAVAGLDVHKGLKATLFASEPMILSPTNIDIDHRGRVWVCEVVNYRGRNGTRKEGDRIVILEDIDHDGVADTSKVFYQGRDIDTAMGICVLGNKVIVSVAPDVFVFTDEDGDDKADKKESLFTKVGQPQHDHSAHAFMFGPDGKLYWNFGNTGMHVHDRNGNLVVDQAGHQVVDNGKPYFGGMPFRCNLDGSEFEVLAHNFRNNYEVTVDSFGTIWQSDNDDDGNQAVRINYVMEFGNFGYRDEITGASWRDPRTGMHEEIPLRHWHLNDPGVVPNLLQTGAGSPTGICLYEGRLLPKVFHDQIIHADAGPNVVRAYPVENDGAGYKAKMVNILQGSRDKWFRPSDVCVAPDGSLFVADWYDPGVGGHRMGDVDKGRIFRVAPPRVRYEVPEIDLNSIDGAIEALKSPNLATRYLAWTALHERGTGAEDALRQVYDSDLNPRFRARALWLLGKIPGKAEQYVQSAVENDDPNLRILGLRLARQQRLELLPLIAKLATDPSVQVRRECAISLRFLDGPEAADVWTTLALQHDGKDRWYLEALGIAADGKWDLFLNHWLKRVSNSLQSPAGRDIVWRSRAEQTPRLLAQILTDPTTEESTLPRYIRALDFQTAEYIQPVLADVAFRLPENLSPQRKKLIAAEALVRLKRVDLAGNAEARKTLNTILDGLHGSDQFVMLVSKFGLNERYPDLLQIAQKHPADELGISATRTLLEYGQEELLRQAITGTDEEKASATLNVLGNSADGRSVKVLRPLLAKLPSQALKEQAVRALAKTRNGARYLLELAEEKELPEEMPLVAAAALNAAPWDDVREQAAKVLPLPASGRQQPLPSIAQLLNFQGNAYNGKLLFENEKKGTCINCHQIDSKGKDVGPALTEIGSKLSRQAMFESILFPSAGISHNYETHILALEDGNVVTGIITNQAGGSLSIKTADGITRTYKEDEIVARKRSSESLMPADVTKELSAQDVVDIVEYMMTLKKK